MSDKHKQNEKEIEFQDAPYFPLNNEAKQRIHDKLLHEAEIMDKQKQQMATIKKASVWVTGIAAIVLFAFLTLPSLNDTAQYDKSSDDSAYSEGDKAITEDSVNDENKEKSVMEDEEEGAEESADTDADRELVPDTITEDFVANNLAEGMSKAEIEALLGSEYSVVLSAMDQTVIWRYDYGVVEGYSPYEITTEDGKVMDSADLEAIQANKIESQLFIGWDGDVLNTFSFYYISPEDNILYNYRITSDGTVKRDQLNY